MTKQAIALLPAVMLAAGCLAQGSATETETVTLTALDQEHGERPLIDPSAPVHWMIDGTESPVDLGRVDMVVDGQVRPLADVLATTAGLSREEIEQLGRERFDVRLDPGDAPEAGLGRHEQGLQESRNTGEQESTSGGAAKPASSCVVLVFMDWSEWTLVIVSNC